MAIRPARPLAAVEIAHRVGRAPHPVLQGNPLAAVAQAAEIIEGLLVNRPKHRALFQAVDRPEQGGIPPHHQVAARRHDRIVGKTELEAAGELPAGELHRRIRAIIELYELAVPVIGDRVIHDLVDHDARFHVQPVLNPRRGLRRIAHLAPVRYPGLALAVVARTEVDRVDHPSAPRLDERQEDIVALLADGEIQPQGRLGHHQVAAGRDDRVGGQLHLLRVVAVICQVIARKIDISGGRVVELNPALVRAAKEALVDPDPERIPAETARIFGHLHLLALAGKRPVSGTGDHIAGELNVFPGDGGRPAAAARCQGEAHVDRLSIVPDRTSAVKRADGAPRPPVGRIVAGDGVAAAPQAIPFRVGVQRRGLLAVVAAVRRPAQDPRPVGLRGVVHEDKSRAIRQVAASHDTCPVHALALEPVARSEPPPQVKVPPDLEIAEVELVTAGADAIAGAGDLVALDAVNRTRGEAAGRTGLADVLLSVEQANGVAVDGAGTGGTLRHLNPLPAGVRAAGRAAGIA